MGPDQRVLVLAPGKPGVFFSVEAAGRRSRIVGSVVTSSSGVAGHYALDVTTDHGTVHLKTNEDTLSSLSQSALASELTRTGITPTWGS